MEVKKSAKADLQNKKGIFLEIGLCASIALMLLLFSWRSGEIVVEEMVDSRDVVEEELAEFTREEITPPEPVRQEVQVIADIISVVSNDQKIETTLTFDELDDGVEFTFTPAVSSVVEEAVEEDAPFITVSDMPKFQGGDLNAFRNWVQTQLVGNYPVVAQENGIQGRVTLGFVIERDGSLTNIQVISSPDRSLSEAAAAVLQSSPKWTPGSNRGVPARVRFTLPVDFQLQ
jgi:protein TonB